MCCHLPGEGVIQASGMVTKAPFSLPVKVLLCGVPGGAGGQRHSSRCEAAGALELLHVPPAALSRRPAAPEGLERPPTGFLHQ